MPKATRSKKAWDFCGTKMFFQVLEVFVALTAVTLAKEVDELTTKGPQRIIEGSGAQSGWFPWMVGLLRNADGTAADKSQNHFCGGSLIDREWVLTAAHCVVAYPDVSVLIGAVDLRFWYAESFSIDGTDYSAEWRDVEAIHLHPDYDHDTSLNDIALLKLAAPSSLPEIAALKLERTARPADGTVSLVAGWGDTTDTGNTFVKSYNLQYTWVPLIDDDVCRADLATASDDDAAVERFDEDVMFCAGFDEDNDPDPITDACQDDSGGPLVVLDSEDNVATFDEWRQVGIVSWGVGCADSYGVYADAVALSGFVDETIGRDDRSGGGSKKSGGGSLDTAVVVVVVLVTVVSMVAIVGFILYICCNATEVTWCCFKVTKTKKDAPQPKDRRASSSTVQGQVVGVVTLPPDDGTKNTGDDAARAPPEEAEL